MRSVKLSKILKMKLPSYLHRIIKQKKGQTYFPLTGITDGQIDRQIDRQIDTRLFASDHKTEEEADLLPVNRYNRWTDR